MSFDWVMSWSSGPECFGLLNLFVQGCPAIQEFILHEFEISRPWLQNVSVIAGRRGFVSGARVGTSPA